MEKLKSKKRFSQNFLVDKDIIADLVEAAEVGGEDVVLEVGAGSGNVTTVLTKCVRSVIAVEIDKDLISTLKKNLEGCDNIKIVNEDILRFLATSYKLPVTNYKVVGSIPYQITSPLLHKLLTLANPPSITALIVQKEVAKKIVAKPPRATYLSNFVKATADAKIVREVPKKAFHPRPEVDGAIIKFKMQKSKFKIDPEKWGAFLHRGFAQPRKMIKSVFDKSLLEKAGLDEKLRPANLTLAEWQRLYRQFDTLEYRTSE